MAGRLPIVGLYDYSPTGTASGGFLATAPASNLIIPRPDLTAMAGGGSVSGTITLAAAAPIGMVHIQNLIADPGASVSVNLGGWGLTVPVAPSDINGPYSDAEIESLGRQRFFIPPAPVTTGAVNFSVTGSGTPVQIGYIGVLSIWQSPIGLKFDWGITVKDLSTLDRVTMGSPYVTEKRTLRVLNLAFDFLRQGGIYGDAADQVFAGGAFPASVIAGKKRPTAGVPFPDDTDNIERLSVGGFINTDQQWTNPFFATWASSFQIEQM